MPDLAKHAAKWEAYAERANVLPLGRGEEEENDKNYNRKQKKFDLKPNADLSQYDGPFIEKRGFNVRVEAKKPGTQGVLIAQGGTAHGFTLYLKDGRLHFATRVGTQQAVVIFVRG